MVFETFWGGQQARTTKLENIIFPLVGDTIKLNRPSWNNVIVISFHVEEEKNCSKFRWSVTCRKFIKWSIVPNRVPNLCFIQSTVCSDVRVPVQWPWQITFVVYSKFVLALYLTWSCSTSLDILYLDLGHLTMDHTGPFSVPSIRCFHIQMPIPVNTH